jgi:hypothetical protein
MLIFDKNTKSLVCSCIHTGLCYHKLAVYQILELDPVIKKGKNEYSLSKLQLRKRRGAGIGRSGRRKPRPRDEDMIIIPAPDSIANFVESGNDEGREGVELSTVVHKVEQMMEVEEESDGFKELENQQQREYEDLQPGVLFQGSTLADAIEKIILLSGLEDAIFSPDPILEELARKREYGAVLRHALRFNLSQYDVILQQMWVDGGTHYIIGGIMFGIDTVFILDSLKTKAEKRLDEFKILLQIVSATLATVGKAVSNEWKCVYASDAAQQPNAFDCGLLCAANVHVIVNCKKFSDLPFATSEGGRKWVKNILLGDQRRPRPMTKKLKISESTEAFIVSEIESIKISPSIISTKRINKVINEEVRKLNKNWTICDAVGCLHDENHELKQTMCDTCRKWFHPNCEEFETVESFPGFTINKCMACYVEQRK